MNRIEFLKTLPLFGLLPFSQMRHEPEKEKEIQHIHIQGDGVTVQQCVVHGDGKHPGILVTGPTLYDQYGRPIR